MAEWLRPWWVALVLPFQRPRRVIQSGAPVVGGDVQGDPSALAAAAGVPRVVYTLARNTASEHGAGTPEEKMLIALAAVHRARARGITVDDLLLFRQDPADPQRGPHRGRYGPIHGPEGLSTAPYGRWASTSQDPARDDLLVAALALAGQAEGFTRADDQWSPRYSLAAGDGKARAGTIAYAARGDYWIGHLPNVDPWEVMAFEHAPGLAPAVAQQRLRAALVMLESPGVYPRATTIAPRPELPGWRPGQIMLGTAAAVLAGKWLWRYLAARAS